MSLIAELASLSSQMRNGCALLMEEYQAPTKDELDNSSIDDLNKAYRHTLDVLHSLTMLDENTRGTVSVFIEDMTTELRAVSSHIKEAQDAIKQEVLAHYNERAKEHADLSIDTRKLVPLGGFSIRNNIQVCVKDKAVVPDQYKTINMGSLKAALKRGVVPGTSFTIERSVAYRADGDTT